MLSFIMISNETLEESIYNCFATLGTVHEQGDGGFYVQYCDDISKGRISYLPSEEIYNDYEEEEIIEIKKYIKEPFFYLIEFRNGSINISNMFISNFVSSADILIDNDHGKIASLKVCKDKVSRGENFIFST